MKKDSGLKTAFVIKDMPESITRKSIEAPIRTIIENSGKDAGYIIGQILKNKGDYGYNARTEEYENLRETGVIDPTKVARVALENAASIASMLLTTEGIISNNKSIQTN